MDDIVARTAADGAALYVRYLVAAEQAVARGEFNNAKMLRALAYSHRAVAMHAVRAQGNALPVSELLARSRPSDDRVAKARNGLGAQLGQVIEQQALLAARALEALASAADVPESVVPLFLFTCVNCGHIAEGERPETCPICGALSVEFDSFGPFYAADAEHLGRLTPARILAILAATPDEIRALVTDVDDAVLAAKPSASEWSVKEIIGHIVVTDGLFVRRVDAILDQAEYQQPMPPWDLHVGKGYHAKSVHELLDLLESARGRSLNLVQALSPQQWANAWSMLGGSRSVLEIGTWHANHDVGHIAQIRRLLDAA